MKNTFVMGVIIAAIVICMQLLLNLKGCGFGGGGGTGTDTSSGQDATMSKSEKDRSVTSEANKVKHPSVQRKVFITKKGFSYRIDGEGDYDFESLEKAVKAMPSEVAIDYSDLQDNQETYDRVQKMIDSVRHQ